MQLRGRKVGTYIASVPESVESEHKKREKEL
jgi:hypothetical protein